MSFIVGKHETCPACKTGVVIADGRCVNGCVPPSTPVEGGTGDEALLSAMYVAAVNGQPPTGVDMRAALAVVRAALVQSDAARPCDRCGTVFPVEVTMCRECMDAVAPPQPDAAGLRCNVMIGGAAAFRRCTLFTGHDGEHVHRDNGVPCDCEALMTSGEYGDPLASLQCPKCKRYGRGPAPTTVGGDAAEDFKAARQRVAHLAARERQTETGPCDCTHRDDAEACRRDRQRPLTGRCTCPCHPPATTPAPGQRNDEALLERCEEWLNPLRLPRKESLETLLRDLRAWREAGK